MPPRRPTYQRTSRGPLAVDFEGLIRSEAPRYYVYSLRALGSREDAEEVVADACMELHRRWAKVLESRNATAFAFKIFKDTLHSRQRVLLKRPVDGPLEDTEWGGEDDGYGAVDARIALGTAMAELERRSPRQAECVRMYYFAHSTYEEIAAALDITVDAAKASTSLGKRRLCREDHHETRPTGRDEGETR